MAAKRDKLGRLLKGEVLNPHGRKHKDHNLIRMVRDKILTKDHQNDALNLLYDRMMDVKEQSALRIACAKELLDRGWGRAPALIKVNTDNEGMIDALQLLTSRIKTIDGE